MGPLSLRRFLVGALLWLAAPFARAADVGREGPVVVPAVYAMPAPAWTQALPPNLINAAVPGLDVTRAQSAAPIAYQLQHGLGLSPEQFAKLPEEDRASAVHLAVEQARHDLTQKAYELVADSKKLAGAKDAVTKADLDALYPVADNLREITRFYGSYLSPGDQKIVAASALHAAASWREARAAFVARFGEATKKALAPDRDVEEVSIAVGAPPKLPPFTPGGAARDLYEQMRRHRKGDYGQKDYATLLKGYGFAYRDNGGHRVYFLEAYPRLSMPVPRHNDLKPYLVDQAVTLIEERMALSAPQARPAAAKKDPLDLPPPIDYAAAEKPVETPQARPQRPARERPAPRAPPAAVASLETPLSAPETAKPTKPAAPIAPAAKPVTAAAPAAKRQPIAEAKFTPAEPEPAAKKMSRWDQLRARIRAWLKIT